MKIYNKKNMQDKRTELRNNLTTSEARLWKQLQRKKLGKKFRRQFSIDEFILDFYCPECKLCIEIDGTAHAKTYQYDEARTEFLAKIGIKVLRFQNIDVKDNLEGVLIEIKKHLIAD